MTTKPLVCLAACLTLLGCKKTPEQRVTKDVEAGPPCQFDEIEIEVPDCPSWTCGSNSPIVGSAEFNLRGEGKYVIVSRDKSGDATIQRGGYHEPETIKKLTVRNGAFLADGSPIREAGWWFQVEEEAKRKKRTCIIEVTGIRNIEPYYPADAPAIPAYTLEIDRGKGRRGLCREKRPWGRWKGPGILRKPTGEALLVANERYNRDKVEVSESPAEGWFNIACAGNALAKVRLMGLDPESDTSTADDRQTALKMVTAKYCVAPYDFTKQGNPLELSRCSSGQCSIDLAPDGMTKKPVIEAYWNKDGATCMTHTRLFSSLKPPLKARARNRLPKKCRGKAGTHEKAQQCEDEIRKICTPLRPCTGADATEWKTQAVDHPGAPPPSP